MSFGRELLYALWHNHTMGCYKSVNKKKRGNYIVDMEKDVQDKSKTYYTLWYNES